MNKVTIMEDWITDLENDPRLGSSINETTTAYLLYGLYKYGVSGENVDLGAIFGPQFGVLNFVLSSLCSQMDRIRNFSKGEHKGGKYDNDAIRELASQGLGPKEICEKLEIDPAKAKSLASNKGYKEGRDYFKSKQGKFDTFGF